MIGMAPPPLPFSFWGAGWEGGGAVGLIGNHYIIIITKIQQVQKKCGTGCPRIDYDS